MGQLRVSVDFCSVGEKFGRLKNLVLGALCNWDLVKEKRVLARLIVFVIGGENEKTVMEVSCARASGSRPKKSVQEWLHF